MDVRLPVVSAWCDDTSGMTFKAFVGLMHAYARAAVELNRPVVDDEMIRRARSAWFEEAYKEGGNPYRVGDANWRAALQAALGAEHGN